VIVRVFAELIFRAVMDQYFGTILQLLFSKLQGKPADSFKLRFARFYHLVSARLEAGYGADYFIKHSDILQANVFQQVYPPFILQETDKLVRPVDRKLAVVSYTKTICNSQAFANRFQKGWAHSCRMLLSLLVNPPTVAAGFGDEIIAEADVDDIGFGLSYTALNTCKAVARDDYPEITDVKLWVKEYVTAADQQHNGAIKSFVQQRLGDEEQHVLALYFA
jgi:exportin-2 (importin alpha re-exporter)